jgi:hypothetical protein
LKDNEMSTGSIVRVASPAWKKGLLAAGVAAALVAWPLAGSAQVAGPFARFDGHWKGVGRVSDVNGKSERIACRADYSIPPSGNAVSQSLVCASDSYRFEVQSDVVLQGGRNIQGRWEETTRHAQGDLVGTISNEDFEGTVTGTGFTAGISIRMTGNKQAVVITPHGSDIVRVDIVMTRGA